jgi:hypothetical protein
MKKGIDISTINTESEYVQSGEQNRRHVKGNRGKEIKINLKKKKNRRTAQKAPLPSTQPLPPTPSPPPPKHTRIASI